MLPSDVVVPTLAVRVKYDASTGVLTWLPRRGEDRESRRWNARYAGKPAGCTTADGYVVVRFTMDGRRYKVFAHRVAWYCMTGHVPEYSIDHADGDPSNNRANNLRDVPAAANARNAKQYANNTSGITGVCWNKRANKWVAQVGDGSGKRRHLGRYTNKDAAAIASKKFREANGFSG